MNKKKKKHIQNKKNGEMAFFGTKAAFVAGIVVFESLLRDVVKTIFGSVPTVLNLILAFVTVGILALALTSTKLDKMLKSKGVDRAGIFMTVMASVVFILESIFESSDPNDQIMYVIIYIVFGLVIAYLAVKIITHKYE